MRRQVASVLVVCAIATMGTSDDRIEAAGYWNVPSNLGQRTGHGFSGGYHAPLVLGPMQRSGWHWGQPTRLAFAPTPFFGCASCDDGGRFAESPTVIEGVVPTNPTDWPQSVAAPVATQPSQPTSVNQRKPSGLTESEVVVESVIAPVEVPTSDPVKPLFTVPPVQR